MCHISVVKPAILPKEAAMNDAQAKAASAKQPTSGAMPRRKAYSENIEVAHLEALSWKTDADVEASINALYRYAEARADESIRWYWKAKRTNALWSRLLRVGAIGFAALGGLAPIVSSLDWFGQSSSHLIGQVGYISLGIAAACVGFDKFFGFSSGWMRYVLTAMIQQEALSAFRLDWAVLSAQLGKQTLSIDEVKPMIQRVKDFVQQIDQSVEQETKAWMTEFQTNLSDIDRITGKSDQLRSPLG
jgi:hypothetical protein